MKLGAFNRFVIMILLVIVLFTGPVAGSTFPFIAGSILLIVLILVIRKISYNELLIIFPLVVIILLGIMGTILNKGFLTTGGLYLFGKDLWYFGKPVIFLMTGFYLYRTGLSVEKFVGMLVIVALVTAVYHIGRVFIYITFVNHNYILDTLKSNTSFTSVLEAFSLGFVLGRGRYSRIKENIYFPRWVTIAILVVSIGLSFSRTVIVAFLIVILSMSNYFSFRLNIFFRTLIRGTIIAIAGYLILIVIHNMSQKDSNLNLFTAKFLNSVNEVTFNRTEATFTDINRNWRGYESNLARKVISNGDISDKFFGYGFGKTVFIGYSGYLGPTNIFIPIFHNGFVQIRLKTGYMGLLLYICFFLMAFRIADRNNPSTDYDNFLKAMLVTAFLSTLVITGIYNKTVYDPVCVITGYFLSMNLIGGRDEPKGAKVTA